MAKTLVTMTTNGRDGVGLPILALSRKLFGTHGELELLALAYSQHQCRETANAWRNAVFQKWVRGEELEFVARNAAGAVEDWLENRPAMAFEAAMNAVACHGRAVGGGYRNA